VRTCVGMCCSERESDSYTKIDTSASACTTGGYATADCSDTPSLENERNQGCIDLSAGANLRSRQTVCSGGGGGNSDSADTADPDDSAAWTPGVSPFIGVAMTFGLGFEV